MDGRLSDVPLPLHFAPREDIITGEAMRPAVAENGRQRFDMLRRRAPCRRIFKGFHVPHQKLRDCRACRRRRRRAPTRAADKLTFAGVELRLNGFKSLGFGFGKKLLTRGLPDHGSRNLKTHCRSLYSTYRKAIRIPPILFTAALQYGRNVIKPDNR